MLNYLGRRIVQALLVLWAAFTVSFLLLQVLPGDAVLIKFLNPELGLTAEQIAELRSAYNADQGLATQYAHTLGQLLSGHFGYSIQAGVPVEQQLRTSLPPTLKLAALAFALASVIAGALAFLSSLTPLAWLRAALRSVPSLFVSLPTFWLGIMLIQLLSFQLHLVPVINPGAWEGLLLPVLTLAIPISAPLAQVLTRKLEEVGSLPFVAVARAKGASRGWVLWHHVARNALLPTLTMAGVLFGELLAGAVVTETVFGLNGLGSLTQQAVSNQDVAVLQALVLISAIAFVVINLGVDLLVPLLDPRLKPRTGAAA
jgi:peptide/nickel transport system permease protein